MGTFENSNKDYGIKNIINKNQVLANFLLPNGRTIAETEAATRITVEEIYIKAFANNIAVPNWGDKLATNELTVLAQPDGSEDLASYDLSEREYHVLQQVSPPGKGKWAYLLNDPRYLALKQNATQILQHA